MQVISDLAAIIGTPLIWIGFGWLIVNLFRRFLSKKLKIVKFKIPLILIALGVILTILSLITKWL